MLRIFFYYYLTTFPSFDIGHMSFYTYSVVGKYTYFFRRAIKENTKEICL